MTKTTAILYRKRKCFWGDVYISSKSRSIVPAICIKQFAALVKETPNRCRITVSSKRIASGTPLFIRLEKGIDTEIQRQLEYAISPNGLYAEIFAYADRFLKRMGFGKDDRKRRIWIKVLSVKAKAKR